jgi:hypothetical protein
MITALIPLVLALGEPLEPQRLEVDQAADATTVLIHGEATM